MAERRLRILQVSTADIKGGAEKVAWNLFSEYRKRGHGAWLAVGQKHSADPGVLAIPNEALRSPLSKRLSRWSRNLNGDGAKSRARAALGRLAGILSEPGARLNAYLGLEEFDYPGTRRLLELTPERPDIVHLHNLHGYYFDLRRLTGLCRERPALLTLHDAWMLSGHCAHSFECDKWQTGCGGCPDLSIYPAIERDATATNWRRKQQIYSGCRFYVAAPSRWLMEKVERSMLAPAAIKTRIIPNGVDLDIFCPGDRQAARERLGLPQAAYILLTSGVQPGNAWKDYSNFEAAINRVRERHPDKELVGLALGGGTAGEGAGRNTFQQIPYMEDPQTVALYYQASDLYVHPARVDTFPTAVLEAMACGIPAAATAVGGIPEQIQDGITGFLVPPADPDGLAARISQLIGDPNLRAAIGAYAANYARRHFSLLAQVEVYLEWYREIIADWAGKEKSTQEQ